MRDVSGVLYVAEDTAVWLEEMGRNYLPSHGMGEWCIHGGGGAWYFGRILFPDPTATMQIDQGLPVWIVS